MGRPRGGRRLLRGRRPCRAVIHDRAVVRAEDDQGLLGEFEAVGGLHEFADAPVELDDRVAARTVRGGSGEAFGRQARDV